MPTETFSITLLAFLLFLQHGKINVDTSPASCFCVGEMKEFEWLQKYHKVNNGKDRIVRRLRFPVLETARDQSSC
ncbi:hypothetical protein CEXT_222051 [Caerostris extrusa]|uniref:Secreted protein n=1 Tax=Caerostris extrusa TaxID=172846 RepID=A0AAV4VU03_CAEEX|nr:hypothetical protein CEXT_222051 [Caerostris extrusa]